MSKVPTDYYTMPKATSSDGMTPEPIVRANRIEQIAKKKRKLNFDKIPLDDKKTWDLICSGMTKGVFQLEKQLGKRYCKEIKPRSVDELCDVISLIRPGCLEAEFREKPDDPGSYSSITHTYIKVKHGVWQPEYIHECLEPILGETCSVPIYQEQIMRICTDFAGFSLREADVARKAVGKKKADVMAKVKQNFLAGAQKNGHDAGLAETIFGWIEKFSGYGFNKSHGISYALIAYKTAYAKAHYPVHFFRAMLANSDGKQDSLDEIQELVHEARYFGIKVKPPSIKNMNLDFTLEDSKTLTFGLGHIKGVGKKAHGQLEKIKDVTKPNHLVISAYGMCRCCPKGKVRSNVAEALIKSGSLDYLGLNRIRLLARYKAFGLMTERERKFVIEQLKELDFNDALQALLDSKIPNKRRKPKLIGELKELNKSLNGNTKRMSIAYEKHYLGIPLSGSLVDLYYNEKVNTKCGQFVKLKDGEFVCMGVVIEQIRRIKDKNGNRMCFLKVSDDTYMIDSVVVFASFYNKIAWILEEGKPVLITGKKNRGSLLVKDIQHL